MSTRTWVDIAYALEREDELRCRHRCTGQCLPDTPGPNVCNCENASPATAEEYEANQRKRLELSEDRP